MKTATLGALALATFAIPSIAQAHPWWKPPKTEHGTSFSDASASVSFERIGDNFTAGLGGTAWIDHDDDDDLDLILVNSPGGDHGLFRNDSGAFTNVATEAGVTGDGSGHTGALAGDIDNDGCTDLFLTGAGGFLGAVLPHRLYLNNCDGTFSDITTASGIDPLHNGVMASFGDIDNDGFIDLYVASTGDFFTGELSTQKLYHNQGDGTFVDISAYAGIDTAFGGCVTGMSDFNNDGLTDLLMGNCGNLDTSGAQPFPIPGPWELWINQGDLTFVDTATAAGLNARPGFPMAVTMSDYDLDGDLDIFATGMGPENPFMPGLLGEQVLFRNNGDGTFADATYEAGLGGWEWGWGASFADFDNDGDDDLVTVGSVALPVMTFLGDLAGPGRIFENDGNGYFEAVDDFGLENQATSGLAVADYDSDGFPDIAIVKTAYALTTPEGTLAGDGAPVIQRNEGNANNSVTIRLRGTASNSMGIGARVHAFTPARQQVKEVVAGSSFASTNSPWLTFGLGRWHLAFVVVSWPSGLDELYVAPAIGELQTFTEGTGICL
ncbi:MAG: CRTAC1 family protein [Deltaproteobacteria bacterium]|nr:CRTAC1 family protein [Deltaproteobacteria bacterium]